MNFIPITDTNLPELLIYRELRDHTSTADNSFIADSSKVVNKILEADIEIRSIFATPEYYEEFKDLIQEQTIPKLYVATKEIMAETIGHKLHHTVMLHGVRPRLIPLEELDPHIIMIDEISSAENVGSIARSAAALGINSYLLPQQGPHPFGRRALRVSMGHMAMLKTHLYDNIIETLKALKKRGYTIYAAEITEQSIPLEKVKVSNKWVLLMGHEGKGISTKVLELCDHTVHIEMMPNIKSFNVAVASSILMYRFTHQCS